MQLIKLNFLNAISKKRKHMNLTLYWGGDIITQKIIISSAIKTQEFDYISIVRYTQEIEFWIQEIWA